MRGGERDSRIAAREYLKGSEGAGRGDTQRSQSPAKTNRATVEEELLGKEGAEQSRGGTWGLLSAGFFMTA